MDSPQRLVIVEDPPADDANDIVLDESSGLQDDFDSVLDEKAEKTHLTATNVKSLIKEVAQNEYVVAMIRKLNQTTEDTPSTSAIVPYEPKFTRSKAKKLMETSGSTSPLQLNTPPIRSPLLDVLLNEELQDESDEEYVPRDEEILEALNELEDLSELDRQNQEAQDSIIALRTRSKLSLHETPLETIEGTYQPPDVTASMYDVHCDDEVWRDFLHTFQLPLDQNENANEDDDLDPEYNILNDEDAESVDREELRDDKAVNVTKRELTALINEFCNENDEEPEPEPSQIMNETSIVDNPSIIIETQQIQPPTDVVLVPTANPTPKSEFICEQFELLIQQLMQCIQMIAQMFILTYEHPDFHNFAGLVKRLLVNLRNLRMKNSNSILYQAVNLDGALELIAHWEDLFEKYTEEVALTKIHVIKVLAEVNEARVKHRDYIPTFPTLILQTISNSDVFLYPNLLPRIPLKSIEKRARHFFSPAEDRLIAFELEHFYGTLKNNPHKYTYAHGIFTVSRLIVEHSFPWMSQDKLFNYISRCRKDKQSENPIKFYFENQRAPLTQHLVMPIKYWLRAPPCQRAPESLPAQWRQHIYPDRVYVNVGNTNIYPKTVTIPISLAKLTKRDRPTQTPTTSTIEYLIRRRTQAKDHCKTDNSNRTKSTAKPSSKIVIKQVGTTKVGSIEGTHEAVTQTRLKTMEMPTLQGDHSDPDPASDSTKNDAVPVNMEEIVENVELKERVSTSSHMHNFANLDEKIVSSAIAENMVLPMVSSTTSLLENCQKQTIEKPDISTSTESSTEEPNLKDNMDDINQLMKASSTVKSVYPTGAERKRVKITRNFLDNIAMTSPLPHDVKNQKECDFAAAYLKKLRTTLDKEDYRKIMEIFVNYDEIKNADFQTFYKSVDAILAPNYKELSEEFLLFLTEVQAYSVDRLIPFYVMRDMAQLMTKLQIFFQDRPSKFKKFLKSMTDLTKSPDDGTNSTTATMEQVKTTILPHLEGSTLLTEWFMQIFPENPPSNVLLKEAPSEFIDLVRELGKPTEETVIETVRVPDNDGRYGGWACVCSCHKGDDIDPRLRSKLIHCKRCGLKFVQGKPYIHTRGGLRAANITFPGNPDVDHNKRLMAVVPRKKGDSPNSKDGPQSQEMLVGKTTMDLKGMILPERRRRISGTKRKKKTSESSDSNLPHTTLSDTNESPKTKIRRKCRSPSENDTTASKKNATKTNRFLSLSSTSSSSSFPSSSGLKSNKKSHVVVNQDEKVSAVVDSDDFKPSTVSKDDGFATNTATESSEDTSASTENLTWSRDEDKTILQTVQKTNNSPDTFNLICEKLPNRTLNEVQQRFYHLMTLLQKMSSEKSTT